MQLHAVNQVLIFSQGRTLTAYRLEQLEARVAEHNNFARRMPVIEEQIKVINHRLADIEEEEKHHEN